MTAPDRSAGPETIVVARIGKPHGLRGEVTVRLHTDDPDRRLAVGNSLPTEPADRGPLVIRQVRVHQGVYLLAFEGHSDRNAAEALRGTLLVLPQEHISALDDEADLSDQEAWRPEELIGAAVFLPDGSRVGELADVHLRGAQDLLEIALDGGGDALIPFVSELVPEVDAAAGRIVIDPPAGLLDLGNSDS